MTESPMDPVVKKPSAWDEAYGVIFLFGILIFALAGLVFLVSAVGPACACTKPVDLVVVNRSTTTAYIDWHVGEGLFGTPLFRWGGRVDAPACQITEAGLDKGAVTATTTAGTQTLTSTITVDRLAFPSGVIEIAANGQISVTAGAEWPGTPDGGAGVCP